MIPLSNIIYLKQASKSQAEFIPPHNTLCAEIAGKLCMNYHVLQVIVEIIAF